MQALGRCDRLARGMTLGSIQRYTSCVIDGDLMKRIAFTSASQPPTVLDRPSPVFRSVSLRCEC